MTMMNPFQDFLEEEPGAAYFSHQNQWGGSPAKNKYWQNQFANVYNKYLGQLGVQAQAGETPSLNWTDYLKDYDFNNQFSNLPPGYRSTSAFKTFSPSLNWLISR